MIPLVISELWPLWVILLVVFGISVTIHSIVPRMHNFEAGDCIQDTFFREKWEETPRIKRKILKIGDKSYKVYDLVDKYETTSSFFILDRCYEKMECPNE